MFVLIDRVIPNYGSPLSLRDSIFARPKSIYLATASDPNHFNLNRQTILCAEHAHLTILRSDGATFVLKHTFLRQNLRAQKPTATIIKKPIPPHLGCGIHDLATIRIPANAHASETHMPCHCTSPPAIARKPNTNGMPSRLLECLRTDSDTCPRTVDPLAPKTFPIQFTCRQTVHTAKEIVLSSSLEIHFTFVKDRSSRLPLFNCTREFISSLNKIAIGNIRQDCAKRMREAIRLGAGCREIDICPAAIAEDSLLETWDVAVSRDMSLEPAECAGARQERGCERDFLHRLFSFLYKDTNLIPKFLRKKLTKAFWRRQSSRKSPRPRSTAPTCHHKQEQAARTSRSVRQDASSSAPLRLSLRVRSPPVS